jgi:hypothetical protein
MMLFKVENYDSQLPLVDQEWKVDFSEADSKAWNNGDPVDVSFQFNGETHNVTFEKRVFKIRNYVKEMLEPEPQEEGVEKMEGTSGLPRKDWVEKLIEINETSASQREADLRYRNLVAEAEKATVDNRKIGVKKRDPAAIDRMIEAAKKGV